MLAGVLCSGGVAAQQGSGIIAGQVVDATSGLPVASATVRLQSNGRTEVTVDSQGRFVFTTLGTGGYTLSATTPTGYAEGFAFVQLGLDERVVDVPVRLRRHGSIGGTVRDDAGDPLVGAPVSVFLRNMFLARPVLIRKGGTKADDRGNFRIADLPAGDYLICACGGEAVTMDKQLLRLLGATPPSDLLAAQIVDNTAPRFVPAFHPGSTVTTGATAVSLGAADDRAGIDITVRVVRSVRVSGQLHGVSANPVTEMTFLLVPEGDMTALGATTLSPVHVTAEGTFEFASVPPGRFSLEVFPKDPRKGAWASVPITVADDDVDGLDVVLGAGATVIGHVEFSGDTNRPRAASLEQSRVALVPVDPTPRLILSSGSAMLIGHWSAVDRDGRFRVENLPPGRYMMSVTGLAAWTTDTVRGGEGANPDVLLTVGDRDLNGVVITMSDTAPGTLEVTLELDRFEAPQQFRVLMFPADASMWVEPFRYSKRFLFVSSSTPTFRFPAVPAGDYFVTMEAAEMSFAPESLELWSRRATRITLKPGEAKTVTLRK